MCFLCHESCMYWHICGKDWNQNGSERFLYVGASSPENGFGAGWTGTVQNGSMFVPQKGWNGSERFWMSWKQYRIFSNTLKLKCIVLTFFKNHAAYSNVRQTAWRIILGKNIWRLKGPRGWATVLVILFNVSSCGRLATSPPGRRDKKWKPPR